METTDGSPRLSDGPRSAIRRVRPVRPPPSFLRARHVSSVFALQQQAGNQAVQRLLRTSASPHSAATTPAHAQAYIGPQLNDAINEIKRELDHLVYTDNVEDRVLKILSRWSED